MQMCDLVELLEYWVDYPPAHVILRAAHLKPKSKSSASKDELMQFVAKAGGRVNRPRS